LFIDAVVTVLSGSTYGQADEAKVTDSLRHVGGVCVCEGWLGVRVDGGVSCDDQVRNREEVRVIGDGGRQERSRRGGGQTE
jgi:hypothetical protein